MPGPLLHLGAVVMCLHGGQATPTMPSPRVLVSGMPVATQLSPYVVAGCALTGTPSPPCVTAQWVVAALRVRSMGAPLLLLDSRAICAPSGQPLIVAFAQPRVTGM